MKDTRFSKLVIFTNALVPLALLSWDAYHQRLGANPPEFMTRTTGILTLTFLTITLAVTPVRKITGLNWLTKFRRMLGLFAFFYGFLHLLTYIWFDRYFKLGHRRRGDARLHRPRNARLLPDGATGHNLHQQDG